VQALAAELRGAGGQAEAVELDATDEPAVVDHLDEVVGAVGSVDVSLNLINRSDVQGQPLLDISVDDFMQPLQTGPRAAFITSRAAARHMVRQRTGGAVLYLTSASSGTQGPGMGGTGATDGAIESYMRALAHECGPQGGAGVWHLGRIPGASTASPRSAHCRAPRLVPTGLATGGCCRQWQIGCRPQPATSERHPIRSFGHSVRRNLGYRQEGRRGDHLWAGIVSGFRLPPTLDDSPAPSPYRL
jgi:NAD(P)-dependent dehydrogenase (short-subunit alcohol dehydrogenase family)